MSLNNEFVINAECKKKMGSLTERRLRVLVVGTEYGHWGNHSGYAGFINHIDQDFFNITLIKTPLGSNLFLKSPDWVVRLIRNWAKRSGRYIFDLNDLVSEWRALLCWLKKKYDIVHFLDGEHTVFLLPCLRLFERFFGRRTRFMATFHQPASLLEQIIDPRVMHRLDRILTVAPCQNHFFEIPNGPKVETILHGIDTDFFSPLPQSTKGGGKPFIILTVGKWLRDSDAVVDVAQAAINDPDLKFYLVSPDIKGKNLPPNIQILTGISDLALLRLYREASLLLLPLKDGTANNALLEAAATGLPIISTDLPSVRTYFPGESAYLVKENSPQGLLEAIVCLKNDETKRRAMSISGRQRALALSWAQTAKRFETTYRAIWRETNPA